MRWPENDPQGQIEYLLFWCQELEALGQGEVAWLPVYGYAVAIEQDIFDSKRCLKAHPREP